MIILKGPNGERQVPEGKAYRLEPGEYVAGSTGNPQETRENAELAKIAKTFGMSLADFIEKAAIVFGIPPCARCEMRKKVLYKFQELGTLTALKLLWQSVFGEIKEVQ